MTKPYKTIIVFEDKDAVIIEVSLLDRPPGEDAAMVNQWLFYDKISKALIKLWLRSSDSSSEIEERYFEQGYLKFNKVEATYIEKFNSAQHKLLKKDILRLSKQIIDPLDVYFMESSFR